MNKPVFVVVCWPSGLCPDLVAAYSDLDEAMKHTTAYRASSPEREYNTWVQRIEVLDVYEPDV